MVDKDGWFVQALLSSYKEVTGDNTPPISMGGSTFGRAFNMGCSFGMGKAGIKDNLHNANENLPVEYIKKSYQIYKLALTKLANI